MTRIEDSMTARTEGPRGPTPLPWTKKLLFSLAAIILSFGLLEVVSRLFVPSTDLGTQAEHDLLIASLGLPDLAKVMAPDQWLFWKLRPNVNRASIAGTFLGREVSFEMSTSSAGLRGPEPGPKGGRLRVLALGDSTTFGLGVNDGETWPARLEEILNADSTGQGFQVINAGVPGYSAFQGLRFLERFGAGLQPDVVVACFGFNDFKKWASKSDEETARLLNRSAPVRFLERSSLYRGLGLLAAKVRPARRPAASDARPRLTPEEFLRTMAALRQWCDRHGARLIYLVWPYWQQISGQTVAPVGYQPVTEEAGRVTRSSRVNLVPYFLASAEDPFVDRIHASRQGNLIAARAIAPLIAPVTPSR